MNKLEKLSKENQTNYLRYLKRMTESMKTSTKGLIPTLCTKSNSILDVGCGSGVLMEAISNINPKTKITGIDLNKEAIDKLKKLGKNWELYHMDLMNLNNKKYDTVIYSSVLHEISSYHPSDEKRFTEIPIKEAFIKTNELLEMNGSIILRDGLLVDRENRNKPVVIRFINQDDANWLYKFQNDFRGFDNLFAVNTKIIKIDDSRFIVGLTFLKEFLYTFTWGASSYPREVEERFGILDKETWINLLEDSGFEVETIVESKEEYEKYLSPKVELKDIHGNKLIYPMMTILIKARKEKELLLTKC